MRSKADMELMEPNNLAGFPVRAEKIANEVLAKFPFRERFGIRMQGINIDTKAFDRRVPILDRERKREAMGALGFTMISHMQKDTFNFWDTCYPQVDAIEDMVKSAFSAMTGYPDRLTSAIRTLNPEWKYGQPTNAVGVLFTGGMDSTALVLKNLDEGKVVFPIYNWLNREFKVAPILAYTMLAAIANTYKGPGILMPMYRGINMPAGMLDYGGKFEGFIQQPLNTFSLAYVNPEITSLLDEVQMGIVKGDQSETFIEDMQKLYDGAFALSHLYGTHAPEFKTQVTRKPSYTFPLIEWDKAMVTEFLEKHGLGGLPLSCEAPTIACTVYAKFTEEERAIIYGPSGDDAIRSVFAEPRQWSIHVVIGDCEECHSCGRSRADGYNTRAVSLQFGMETLEGNDIDPAFIDLGDVLTHGVTISNDVMLPRNYK